MSALSIIREVQFSYEENMNLNFYKSKLFNVLYNIFLCLNIRTTAFLKRIKHKYRRHNLKQKSTEQIFTKIFKKNLWNGTNSISGPGSDDDQTITIRNEIPRLLKELNIKTILDIPCGDFYWMKNVNLQESRYLGADIVEDLVLNNQNKFSKENINFVKLNLLCDEIPRVDLVLCRDCLVHLSNLDIFKALKNVINSNSKYLLCTTFTDRKYNRDIITGEWRSLNLEISPFNFPKPIKIINENCHEINGGYKDKSLGLWNISDLGFILSQVHAQD